MKTRTFDQFNAEINDLYKHLKDNNYSEAEIRKVFSPLKPASRKFNMATVAILVSFLLVVVLYFLTYIETVSWHLSALGRIFLIKMLPYWDWTHLKNQKCLISKAAPTDGGEFNVNCDLCENIQQIDVYEEITDELLKTKYIDVDVPVIVTTKWPTADAIIDNITKNAKIANSIPCSLATNMHNGWISVGNLIQKSHFFDSFFVHFQNCDFEVMKQFRGFTPRPPYLPPELSPVQFNWLLWSRNYNVTHFKTIPLVERVGVLAQLKGGNRIELVAVGCEVECPTIEVKLNEGEAVIITGLWNLRYRPLAGENVAVILELH